MDDNGSSGLGWIGDWLRRLDLEWFEAPFRDNEIEFRHFRELTEAGAKRDCNQALKRDLSGVIRLLERESELTTIRAFARRGGKLVIEGGAGIGKTALLDFACLSVHRRGRLVLRARGSDLESEFAFGIARQLFEHRCTDVNEQERGVLFRGAAGAVKPVVTQDSLLPGELDNSFAIVHGLYWLVVNLASLSAVTIAIDDAHWGDDASLRWLAYLAARLEGMHASLILTLRPNERRSQAQPLLAVRAASSMILRPALLSAEAVAELTLRALGTGTDLSICASIHRTTGGNPFYVQELLRALTSVKQPSESHTIEDAVSTGGRSVALQLSARLRKLNPLSLSLAQAIAVLGDGCELRHAARISQMEMALAARIVTDLVSLDVLGEDRPPRFIHPIVQQAILQTLSSAEHDAMHRSAARVLHAESSPPGRIAAHLMRVRTAGDHWVVARLREGARAALENGAPATAADLLERALAEPPPPNARVELLREAARAHLQVGRACACDRLEEALAIADSDVETELASELARTYASLFRWTEAVRLLERALGSLSKPDHPMAARLESQLVAAGLQDAHVAPRALSVMKRMSHRQLEGAAAVALRVAEGMVAVLTGQPADEAALPLEYALAGTGSQIEDWDLQAALWWSLITVERFSAVEAALEAIREQVDRLGSSRALVAFYSTLGLLKLRLGALPEADAAARVALQVVGVGDFAPGLSFAATVLADVAVASGQLQEAQALVDLLPHESLPAGVGTVLIPAARGRLRLAQGRAREALAEFESCIALWNPAIWGMDVRDVGYVHARSGAAQALLALGLVTRAREVAQAELADVRRFGGKRALGVALRVAGLARGAEEGLSALEESVAALTDSPARLERARSLVELGAVLRRLGRRRDAHQALSQGLDTAARCGAGPLIAYAREELRIAGARPRRDWTSGVEALTPSELRVVKLARDGRSNRQIAEELYLSMKTVEGHLARAYGKLGITARRDLGRVLEPENTRVPTL